jgi:hypothetical protein
MDSTSYGKLTYAFGSNDNHSSIAHSAIATVAYQDGENMKNKM